MFQEYSAQTTSIGKKSGGSDEFILEETAVFGARPRTAIWWYPQFQESFDKKSDPDGVECRKVMTSYRVSLELYATDNLGQFPNSVEVLVPKYLLKADHCPAANTNTYVYHRAPDLTHYIMFCRGASHLKLGENQPCMDQRWWIGENTSNLR